MPIAYALFRFMPDRGYALSKLVGWLFVSWSTWYGLYLGIWDKNKGLIISVAALFFISVLVAIVFFRSSLNRFLLFQGWKYCLFLELIFVLAFSYLTILRAFVPEISQTEKPMDFMYLQTSYLSEVIPPRDLWFAGYGVNYYYFGYYMVSILCRLSGISPAVGYNLGLATIFAVVAVITFSIVINLIRAAGLRSTWIAVAGAIISLLLLLFAGNPVASILAWVNFNTPGSFDWFWKSTRVIFDFIPGRNGPQQTIDEFPAFTFLLGDLHPHLMAMPLLLGVLYCSVSNLYRQNKSTFLVLPALLPGILIGALYMTNSWDVPVAVLVFLLSIVTIGMYTQVLLRSTLSIILLAFTSLVTSYPFVRHFDPPVSSQSFIPPQIEVIPVINFIGHYIGVVWWDHTDLLELLKVWGWHIAFSLFVLVCFTNLFHREDLRILVPLLLVSFIGVIFGVHATLLLPLVVATLIIGFRTSSTGFRYACFLSAVGWLLVVLPEFVYMRDVFEDRMNTVFKFYYQSWQIQSISVGCMTMFALDSLRSRVPRVKITRVIVPIMCALVVLSTGYSLTTFRARSLEGMHGLDGTAFLNNEDPYMYRVVEWVRNNTNPSTVVLEATGGSYTNYSRVSTYAGRPTVLGWQGHELQWRLGQPDALRELSERMRDVSRAYSGLDRDALLKLLEKYSVSYVVYGSSERQMQAEEGIDPRDPFKGKLIAVARFGDYIIYKSP